ncbi:sialidase family protein [Paraburkholderia sp. J7]|uniref:sialidase family protein n=1 Tax=Paraburkholderia sp. J7 TaxID=2805438 RepID=UPI002AB68C08|nr:sialidase family protein [Paraburkholderia sp. J7]
MKQRDDPEVERRNAIRVSNASTQGKSWALRLIAAFIVGLCAIAKASSAIDLTQVEQAFHGTVVAHSPASTGIYLATPSIAILDDGSYLVSHDSFGPRSTQDTVDIYRSRDRGETWSRLAELKGLYYASLFVHRGSIYALGISRFEGVPVIWKSSDQGRTWSKPSGPQDGVLADDGKYFSAAVPVIIANGRIWRTIERIQKNGVWVGMMSADLNGDLTKASSWTFSETLGPNSRWLGGMFNGWLEGNAVVAPSGKVVDLLRVYFNAEPEKAAIVTLDNDGRHMAFDPLSGFVDMPGAGKKFTVRLDQESGHYWSLTNAVFKDSYRGSNLERARNTLALISSKDLRHWNVCRIVLHSNDSTKHGFQYVDWVFDGSDIVSAIRAADDDEAGGAYSQHDSNFIKFLRIPDFRKSSDCQ